MNTGFWKQRNLEMSLRARPLHKVDSNLKVRNIVRARIAGDAVPAIWVYGNVAINGTHRLAANCLMSAMDLDVDLIDVVDISDWDDDDPDKIDVLEALECNESDSIEALLVEIERKRG